MMETPEDRALDAALARWAIDPAGDETALARIIRHGDALAQPAPRRNWRLAFAGTAVAASLALLMMVTRHGPAGDAAEASEGASVASFMLLHSPTPYEEPLL